MALSFQLNNNSSCDVHMVAPHGCRQGGIQGFRKPSSSDNHLIRNPYHSVESYKLIVLPILYVSSIQRIEVVNRMMEVPADSNNIHSSQLLQKPCARTGNSHSIHTLIM